LVSLGGFFFEISEVDSLYFWATFFPQLRLYINFDKNGLGYTLGAFLQTHLATLAVNYGRKACQLFILSPLMDRQTNCLTTMTAKRQATTSSNKKWRARFEISILPAMAA
jgi:hypothetical protein